MLEWVILICVITGVRYIVFMLFSPLPSWSTIAVSVLTGGTSLSQTVGSSSIVAAKIEPGLELAVSWKWWVAPTNQKEWGMPVPEALLPKAAEPPPKPVARPETYEVKQADALIKIAKKFDMTVAQLKQFNELKDDRIRIGQTLRIPTPAQLLLMIPPPPPPEPAKEAVKKKKSRTRVEPEPMLDFDSGGEAQRELDNVRLQVFLDRELFSPGMIDGKPGATFQKISEIYQRTHPDAADPARLKAKAEAVLPEPYTRYNLRVENFKFIQPPETVVVPGDSPGKKPLKPAKVSTAPPPVAFENLVAADFLGYASPWEFVAERFHCDEAFLRQINPHLKEAPVVGTEFQVPNVIPFEIEKALDAPLQPAADPQSPVTAAVVLLSRLEISRGGKLIAVMPLAAARPGLRGRDKWTVLAAIPQPRMATRREPREVPKPSPNTADAPAPITPPLEQEQFLAPGPNNPAGIIWINLAKAGSPEPLAYGLHGTSMPGRMKWEGIGGLRLTNWDIARAARLMPAGTVLQWKAQ